ncbi:MAG: hypothetical protein COX07_00970, partial [Bacteroidetes bacterium CG23_combo_of_CG06-09_8_20_14_all_32_9]
MKLNKVLIFIGLVLGTFFSSYAQLASWDLLTNGLPTQVSANVVAGNFTGGSGISTITYSSNGAYATGWSTIILDVTDYYQIYISPASGYKLTINTLNFGERRSLTSIHTYEVQYAFDPAFTSPVTLATVNVPDDDLERVGNITGLNIIANPGDTIYFRWYGYGAEQGTGTWRINDTTLKITGIISQANLNNNDSYIQNPALQIPAGNISSMATIPGLAVPVFKVSVNDAGTSDGLPTIVTLITLKNTLPANGADWQTTIQGVTIKNGINPVNILQTNININSITFTFASGDLVIPDNDSAELTFSVFLNNMGLTDSS